MARRSTRDLSRLGLIDYLLMSVGSSLAAWSAGMSVAQPAFGRIFVLLILGGTLFSYLVRLTLGSTGVVKADGFLYAAAAMMMVFMTPALNGVLPDEGFPRELMMAGVLCWMLSAGSFLTWRDGTLLFQAVPSIALFGLIGCYDTYKDVPFTFFGFLVCLATLFARSHAREMLRQSAESGYFGREADKEDTSELFSRIKAGPWRWMAGPEWALVSALAVVLISFVGAPVVQETVKPISNLVQVASPRLRLPQQRTPPTLREESTGNVRIGVGPNRELTEEPLFDVKMDQVRYLRAAFFDHYSGRGWSSRFDPSVDLARDPEADTPASLAMSEIENPREFQFSIQSRRRTSMLPVPGEVVGVIASDFAVRPSKDGSWTVNPPSRVQFTGVSVEPMPGSTAVDAVEELPHSLRNTLSLANFHPSVLNLAKEATRGVDKDYEKAQQIALEIGRRVKYNLDAAATPADRDPVEYFLFDQREGYCDVFASAMVQMARSVGIPARYVNGFLPSPERTDDNGNLVVVEADYHAWAELFFKDHGWVVFDATSYAEAVPGSERGAAADTTPWYKKAWFLSLLNAMIGLVVLAGGYYAVRALKPAKGVNLQRSETERLYIAFADSLRKLSGKRRRPSQTPREYLKIVTPHLNGSYAAAAKFTDDIERVLFSPGAIDEAAVAQLRADLKTFKAMLKQQKPTVPGNDSRN